ncbi:DHHA1 domain-containing protein [Pseudoalteromonas sp. Hal099]
MQWRYVSEQEKQLNDVAALVKGDSASVLEKVTALLEKSKGLEKQIAQLNDKLASAAGASLLDSIVEINGVKLLVANVEGTESKALRGMVDDLKNKIGSGVIALGVASGEKVSLIAGVTKDLTGKVKAGELVNHNGRPSKAVKGAVVLDMAQAGGSQPRKPKRRA